MVRQPTGRVGSDIAGLRDQIRRHECLYYDGAPEITDREFDRLMAQLQELEAAHPELCDPYSPTQRVGGEPLDEFQSIVHAEPMLSIDNCFDVEELHSFLEGIQVAGHSAHYSVEYKVDGIALAVHYTNGQFSHAVTRGDGVAGDDVGLNARTIRNLPLVVHSTAGQTPRNIEIRGEVYVPITLFSAYREAEIAAGRDIPANPRNTASGAMRSLQPAEAFRRPLRFVAHGIGRHRICTRHGEFIDICRALGIPTVPGSSGLRREAVMACIERMIEDLPKLDIPIDGIVVKVDSFEQRELLGAGTKYPKWARAYKWERYEAVTTVEGITIQVGKAGVLTPVAELAPVEIAETVVTRASLFNKDEIERLDICVGDQVVVEKAGKIIPHVVRVNKEARKDLPIVEGQYVHIHTDHRTHGRLDCRATVVFTDSANRSQPPHGHLACVQAVTSMLSSDSAARPGSHLVTIAGRTIAANVSVPDADITPIPAAFVFPTECPVCGSEAVQDEDGVYVRCSNATSCPAQLRATLIAYGARDRLDIDGLGPVMVDKLMGAGLLKGIADLYNLRGHRVEMLDIAGVGKGKVDRLLSGIEKSKERPVERLLAGLNIRHVGRTAGHQLARRFGTLLDVVGATKEELRAIPGFGDAIVESLWRFFNVEPGTDPLPPNMDLVARLMAAGCNQGEPVPEGTEIGVLDGLTIVPTGKFELWQREEVKGLIRNAGGKPGSSVSSKTSYIVAGASPGGKKIQKAEELGIEVIDESTFAERLGLAAPVPVAAAASGVAPWE